MSSLFKIDTKGSCLLCFRSRNNISGKENLEVNPAFKVLLDFLQVDVTKLSIFSDIFQRLNCPVKDVDLSVSLCDTCSELTNDFSQLVQKYEEIRILMGSFIGHLIDVMEEGSKDDVSVREFGRRMSTGDFLFQDLFTATIVHGLRKEMKDKAVQKVAATVPMNTKPDDMEEGTSEVSLNDFTTMTPVEPHSNPETSLVTAEVKETSNGNCDGIGTTISTLKQSFPRRGKQNKTTETEVNLKPTRKTTPESKEVTNAREKIVTTTESSQSSKCDYCGKNFYQERNLISHHYTTHTMAVLKDKKLLPPNITEQQLGTTLEQILDQSMNNQCPVCKKAGFRWKFQVRSHLLQYHLEHVIAKVDVGDHTQNIPEVDSAHPKEKPNWKCVPCDKDFLSQDAFDLHQYQKHPETVLAGEGLLPADITRSQLEAAVDDMLTTSAYCQICRRQKMPSQNHLKEHLLLKHLPRLIENARSKVPTENEKELPLQDETRKSNRMIERKARGKSNSLYGKKDFDEDQTLQKPIKKSVTTSKKMHTRRGGKPGHASIIRKKYLNPKPGFGNVWKCVPCRRNFQGKTKFEAHQFNYHLMTALKDQLPSSVSEKTMTASVANIIAQLKRVSNKSHGAKLYECLWCEKKVWNYTDVKVHLLKSHLGQVVQVAEGRDISAIPAQPIAKDTSENREEFVGVVPTQTKCEYCEKDFTNSYLETHMWAQHTFARLSNKGFLPPDVTELHLNQVLADLQKPNELKIRACQICEKEGFQSNSRLRAHLFLSHVDEVVKSVLDLANGEKCQTCPPPCQRGCKRKRVSSRRAGPGPSSNFECTTCGKIVASQVGLKMHITKQHMKSKLPYQCDHCEKRFATQSNINVHLLSCHPVVAFEGHLPIWVTDRDFNNAVQWILRMSEKIEKNPRTENTPATYVRECPICKLQLDRSNRLKLHIARSHLDQIVETMESEEFGEGEADTVGNDPTEGLESDQMEEKGIGDDDDAGEGDDIEIVSEYGPVSVD